MTGTIWISGGVIGYKIDVTNHNFSDKKLYSIHNIPLGSKPVLQNVGSEGKKISVSGYTFLPVVRQQLVDWQNSGTSLVYSGANIYLSGCVMHSFGYSENASPDTFPISFKFNLQEI